MEENVATKPIDSFTGEYRFLSNFEGRVEQEYQAAKCSDINESYAILDCISPGKAKRMGRKVKMRPDWDEVKLDIMKKLLLKKFRTPLFREKLLATGDAELIEGNDWGDTYWGVCKGVGENHLGRLLMEVREELRSALEEQVRRVVVEALASMDVLRIPCGAVYLTEETERKLQELLPKSFIMGRLFGHRTGSSTDGDYATGSDELQRVDLDLSFLPRGLVQER